MEGLKQIVNANQREITGGKCSERPKTEGGGPKELAAEFEMLSPGWALFTVNGEIECVAYLMGFVFIVQHWIINWEVACHIDLSFN